tara:strand:- start:253 stop:672 length:420 start_codon:yes stop_codon:yes gene_type:complete
MKSVAQVRTAIINKVDGITGMREIPFPVEYFGRAQNTIAHLGFSVSISSTQAAEERQRRSNQIFMVSDISVTFSFRLRPHDMSDDINSATDKEQAIIEAVLGTYTGGGFTIRYLNSQRRYPDSLEYIIIEMSFVAHHTP